ncbi:multiple epidermal growth factor-like domains protein 6 [Saccostrea cucullata]|uniref:multiple epidermal growth factor-like domains protein 6 n=1 Tax=Saccostrea cuccullata TaxID=36930 RepID=UPI002ED4B3DF
MYWLYFHVLFQCIYCYENLSRRFSTKVSLSSMHVSLYAKLANDGITEQGEYKLCSHTASGFSTAWLQVDLQEIYSLKSVKIYYRNQTDWPPYRFRQFYLDVSNSSANVTSTAQRTRCYKDKTIEPYVPPALIDIPCLHTARYIIVETTYDAPEDYQIGAILEICEIEVNGCSVGKFGEFCENCQCTTCSIIDGTCPVACSDNCRNRTCSPLSGYCVNGCKELYYGPKCEHQCSSLCNPQSCDRDSGACSACKNGSYGPYCNKTCSPFCRFNVCDSNTGDCHHGCKSNWTGDFCNKCTDSHFGHNCSERCNINCKDRLCNNITGSCTQGCETGFFKETCNENCNPDCFNGCNRLTGYCDNGCVEGKFGKECHDNCGSGCLSKSCARINGNCTCANGWNEDKCTECSPNFYGKFCEIKCSEHCYYSTCFSNNGSCIGGCSGYFTDKKCTKALEISNTLDPASIGLGVGVGASLVILIFGFVIAIVIYIRIIRRKRLAYKNRETQLKDYDNKKVVFRRQDNQKNLQSNILSNKYGASENIVDDYENEIKGGFESKTYHEVSDIDNKYSTQQKNEYLSISETVHEKSIYDQLQL